MAKRFLCALLCGALVFAQSSPVFAKSECSMDITEGEDATARSAESGFTFDVNGEERSSGDIVDAIRSVSDNDVAKIKLTEDVTVDCAEKIVQSAGSLTIDLNGHVLLVEDAEESGSGNFFGYIQVTGQDTALTVKDSSEGKTGKLKSDLRHDGRDSYPERHALINVCNHANFALLSGTIEAENAITGETADEIYVGGKIAADKVGVKCWSSDLIMEKAEISVVCTEKPDYFIPATVDFSGENMTIRDSVIEYSGRNVYGPARALYAIGSREFVIEGSVIRCDTDENSHGSAMYIDGAPDNFILNNVKIVNESKDDNIAPDGAIIKLREKTTLSANGIDVDVKSAAGALGWKVEESGLVTPSGDRMESAAYINDINVNVSAGYDADGVVGLGHYTNCESSVKSAKGWAHAYAASYVRDPEGKTSFENSRFRAVTTKKKNLKWQDNAYGGHVEYDSTVVLKNNCSFYSKGGYRNAAFYVEREFAGNMSLAEGCHWVNSNNRTITDPAKVSYALVTDGSVTPSDSPAPVSIAKKCSFSWSDTGTVKAPRLYYDGTVREPEVILKNKADNTVLTEGVDYTVTYAPKSSRAKITTDQAGAFKVVIEGRGNYSGSITRYYTVKKLPLADAYNDGTGILSYSRKNGGEVEYDPKGAKLEISVSVNGIEVAGDDFDKCFKIGYARNKAVRNVADRKPPVLILKGRGNFSGTLTVPFSINPCDISSENITATISDAVYSTRAGAYMKKPVVKYGSKKLKPGRDYTLKYYLSVSDGEPRYEEVGRDYIAQKGDVIRVEIRGKGNYDEDTARFVDYSVK